MSNLVSPRQYARRGLSDDIKSDSSSDKSSRYATRLQRNGTLLPAAEIGQLYRDRGICFALDAPAAGSIPIDIAAMNVDFLFTGHKGCSASGYRQLSRRERFHLRCSRSF